MGRLLQKLVLAAAIGSAGTSVAQPGRLDYTGRFSELLAKSPFGHEPVLDKQDQSMTEVEFRGYVIEDDEVICNLARTPREGRPQSAWVRVGETFAGHRLVGLNQQALTIEMAYQGKPLNLTLQKAKIERVESAKLSLALVQGRRTSIDTVESDHEEAARVEIVSREMRERRARRSR